MGKQGEKRLMSKRLLVIIVVIVIGAGLLIWRERQNDQRPVLQASSEQQLTTTSVKVGERTYDVEVAASSEDQHIGLSDRDSMPEMSGMIFPFSPPEKVSFWMWNMRFPIDIVWIKNGKVVGITENLPVPASGAAAEDLPTFSPPEEVDYVLELNAGQGKFFKVGESVVISDVQST